jgi:hypothetical protein
MNELTYQNRQNFARHPTLRRGGPASVLSEKHCSAFFTEGLAIQHRQTWVFEFVVAGTATFGTACPRADKQWHEAQESVVGPGW